jgi:hypothetical protein
MRKKDWLRILEKNMRNIVKGHRFYFRGLIKSPMNSAFYGKTVFDNSHTRGHAHGLAFSLCLHLFTILVVVGPIRAALPPLGPEGGTNSPWNISIQYLGLTYHPDGGETPEVYPLKFDRQAYLVLDIGAIGKLDYRLGKYFFARFTSGLYLDCALLMAGCVHTGPRIQYSLGNNSINIGIGPIFSFRQDWHRFEQFEDDDFYGDRVYKGWQYRLYPTALEIEYLRKINDSMELQWSLIPGAPLVITFLVGVRFKIPFRH